MQAPPREVPDYAYALASGLIRPVPASPPPLLPGRTANQMVRRWVMSIVVTGALFIAAYAVIGQVAGSNKGLRGFLLFLASMGALTFLVWGLTRIGRRNVEELARGYTTLQVGLGSYFQTLSVRRSPQAGRLEWDYSGVWVLNDAGGVVAAPDPHVDPPGFFPSPNRPGKLEFWTGKQWGHRFREAPRSSLPRH